MPSPDLTPYYDPVVFDVLPEDLVDRFVAAAAEMWPDWQPLAANLEVELAEVLSVVLSEQVFAVNRLPLAVAEYLLALLGISASAGTPATATVAFRVQDDTGWTVPGGTQLRLELGEGAWVDWITDDDLVVPPGQVVGVADVTASDPGAGANGAPVGSRLLVLDAISFVIAAELASSPVGGTGAEATTDYRARAIARLGRLTEALVLARHFEARALEEVGVSRAHAIDLYDGVGYPGSALGHVAVVVAGPAGVPFAGGAALEVSMQAAAVAGLVVHVLAPNLVPVDVAATVLLDGGADEPTTEAAIVAALGDYLNPDSWPWGRLVRPQELAVVIDGVAGVDVVLAVTEPAGAVALGPTGLPTLGDVVVTFS